MSGIADLGKLIAGAGRAYSRVRAAARQPVAMSIDGFMSAGRVANSLRMEDPTRDGDMLDLAEIWCHWRDCGFRVFELSKHAGQELLLTKGPPCVRYPASAFFVKLPTEDTLGCVGLILMLLYGDPDDRKATAIASVAWDRGGLDAEIDPEPVQRLVDNLCTALAFRQDDLIAEDLFFKKKTKEPRPKVTRVKMRTPVLHLQPHVKRFLLEGERAFHGRRGSYVLGFFRRPPRGGAKTVWVRPHYRAGSIPTPITEEPRIARVEP